MPTTARDARLLAGALLLIAGGLTLIAVGIVIDPPLALLRHLHKEH